MLTIGQTIRMFRVEKLTVMSRKPTTAIITKPATGARAKNGIKITIIDNNNTKKRKRKREVIRYTYYKS